MNVVLTILEPGDKKRRQVGKVVPFGGRLVYTYNITRDDRMRALDAFGVAPCVLKLLLDQGVAEIHYVDFGERVTWATTPERVLRYGIPQRFPRRQGVYFHLPLARWTRAQVVMAQLYPWASTTLELDWIEPAEVPGAAGGAQAEFAPALAVQERMF